MATVAAPLATPETRVVLRGVSWDTYVRLNDEVTSPAVRLAFFKGDLEILTVSRTHEIVQSLLDRLLTSLAVGLQVDCLNVGNVTIRAAGAASAFEPDICYYFENLDRLRGMDGPIEAPRDPAPEVVIEVDISSRSLNKLPAYAAAGCRECWIYRDGRLVIYTFAQGGAEPVPASQYFPGVNVVDLNRLLAEGLTEPIIEWVPKVMQWAAARRTGFPS